VKENYKQIDYTAYETGYQLKLPVETEIFISKDAPVRLLNIAYNVLKLHHKLQKGRLGTGLVIPKGYPAGL
jgi:hypothetical protein